MFTTYYLLAKIMEYLRRIIQRNINSIKKRYDEGIKKQPNLEGRVQIRFVISCSGEVLMADVDSSTPGDTEVENCIAASIRVCKFRPPKDGEAITVKLPFQLYPP